MEMLTGNGHPSRHLVGEVGQHYKNLNNGDIWECISSNENSRVHHQASGGYIWKRIAHGDHMEVCAGGVKMAIMRSSKYLDALRGDELPEGDETWECLNMTYSEAKAIIASGEVLLFVLQMVDEEGHSPIAFYNYFCIFMKATEYVKEHIKLNANWQLFWSEDGISMEEPAI